MSLPETPASNHDDTGAPKMQSVDARVAGNGEILEKSPNGHFASEPEVERGPKGDREDAENEDKDEIEGEVCEEDDEEEEEEEEEPSLKYERIAGAIPDLLKKDAASALAIVNRKMALGTHGGIVHILDLTGKRLKSYKPHMASIVDISIDATGDFVATASIDGQVVIHSLSTPESYAFDMKRPMRTVAMEPSFGKRGTRAFVCGGLSGKLVMRERGWIGHKETLLHSGDGSIWQVRWRGKFIAWADDYGVKIYDTQFQTRFAMIDRTSDSPRADLFKCSLFWQDDSTLVVGWADAIKVVRIRVRQRPSTASPAVAKVYPYAAEVTAHLKLDAMISGLVTHPLPNHGNGNHKGDITGHARSPTDPERQPSPTQTTASSIPSGPGPKYHKEAEPPTPGGHSKHASTSSIYSHISTSSTTATTSSLLSPSAQVQAQQAQARALTGFLIIAYTPPERFDDEMTEDRARQARKSAERPEMRIVSRAGEELLSDALSVVNFHAWGCNDYMLAQVDSGPGSAAVGGAGAAAGQGDAVGGAGRSYVVLSPKDLVLVMPRDKRDHISWLVERKRYEEALEEAEALEAELNGVATATAATAATSNGIHGEKGVDKSNASTMDGSEDRDPLSSSEIGQKFIEYLVGQDEYDRAARLCPKVCGHDAKRWESWIFTFAERRQLQAIIPYVPIESPTLDRVVYDMIMAHFLAHDHQTLLQTIKEWPKDVYDISAVIVAVRSELDKLSMFSSTLASSSSRSTTALIECLAELYTINRQPGKALPYYLRLRRPNVFNLIREHSLFTDVSDQVLLLVEFDDELMRKRTEEGKDVPPKSEAIALLVDNIHSIPITRVVQQLTKKPYYLFLYLDALVAQDALLVAEFADMQVKLYAEYALPRLIDFLRASNYYSLEQAFEVCKERDLVPEMVFLLGKMGNNKQALTLIIERLGDVQRAIEFAKEQNDDDLWEDLLRYSETRPTFIRGLLENVGVEISPIRLIRRIKNGLEIPGLKDALIKILQDFHLQISLLEGCQTILYGDSAELSRKLQNGQTGGFFLTAKTTCSVCSRSIQETPGSLVILYLCRHVVHATCLSGSDRLPPRPDPVLRTAGLLGSAREMNGKIAYESIIRARIGRGCPVCHGGGNEART